MDISNTIRTELARFQADERESEALRWAVWMVWEDRGDSMGTEPKSMNSSEFADACEVVGIKRNTAMNRYSEARKNWMAA